MQKQQIDMIVFIQILSIDIYKHICYYVWLVGSPTRTTNNLTWVPTIPPFLISNARIEIVRSPPQGNFGPNDAPHPLPPSRRLQPNLHTHLIHPQICQSNPGNWIHLVINFSTIFQKSNIHVQLINVTEYTTLEYSVNAFNDTFTFSNVPLSFAK